MQCNAVPYQEGGSFEEYDFIRRADGGEVFQLLLQQLHVGNERVDDLRPGSVERLVPDGRGEALDVAEVLRLALHQRLAIVELTLCQSGFIISK